MHLELLCGLKGGCIIRVFDIFKQDAFGGFWWPQVRV